MNQAERLLRFKLAKSPVDVDRALRYVVRSAYQDVPYYEQAWTEARVHVGSFQGVSDLPRLPVTKKEALLLSPSMGFMNRFARPEDCVRSSTSGSTALPLTVYASKGEAYFRRASLVAAIGKNASVRPPLTMVDVGTASWEKRKDVVQRLGLFKIVRIPRDAPIEDQVRAILDVRTPRYVQGRPSCLELLAEELELRGVRPPSPDLVVSFGEILYPHVRKKLLDLFLSPVADYYSCEEIGNVAWECPEISGRMHLNMDTCVVEVLDAEGRQVAPGQEGRIILTSLYNAVMPFVRYEIGDRGALGARRAERCKCGARGPDLRLLSGREEDFLVLRDGRRISPRVAVQAVLDAIRVESMSNVISTALRAMWRRSFGLPLRTTLPRGPCRSRP